MRRRGLRAAGMLAVLLAAQPGPGHAEPATWRGLDERRIAADVAAGLDFIAPRTLEPIGMKRLALGGLRVLGLLDATLVVQPEGSGRGAVLVLTRGGMPLSRRAAPEDAGAQAWGEAVVQLVRAGWDGSEAIRRAGTDTLVQGFFDAVFAELDPYSHYLSPREASADRTRRAGRAGVGITVALRRGAAVVSAVEPGGAAAQAGIRAGDVLMAVDGQPLNGASQEAVAALLAGPEDTLVTVSVQRRGRIRAAELARSRAATETVTARRDGRMVVVRMAGFNRNTASRLAQELIRVTEESLPTDGLVLDLRGNRGGVLQQAVASAAMLLGGGVVARTSGRHPDASHVFVADGRDLLAGLPVVVLIDGGTASAAEILAGALADQRRAVVVGSASLGKGLVQTVTGMPDGGELFVSWSQMTAPRGWPVQSLGVLPQLCTSLGEEQTARQLAALAHGEQLMRAMLVRHRQAGLLPAPALVGDIRAACPARTGGDDDIAAARALIAAPSSYAAALLGPDAINATRLASPQGLTGGGRVSN